MRTWWEVADEVRGGVVRAREWWIENETAAIKCRLVSAGECQSLHVVDVQTDVGFGSGRVSRKMMWKMNRYSYNAARRRMGVIRSRTYRPRLDTIRSLCRTTPTERTRSVRF
jgi:hypothetical protein